MLTRYAEFAPSSATSANTTSSNIRSRGPTAFTYFFLGNGAGVDSTEFIVVDITNHPGRSDIFVRHPSCATAVSAVRNQLKQFGWFKPEEEDHSARYADRTETKAHQSAQH